jgi:hypothetical protein
MPGEITLHSNKDRHICIKTHAKVSPENITWLTSKSTPKGLIIKTQVFDMTTKFRVLKTAELN